MSVTLTLSIEKDFAKTEEFVVKDGTTWGDPSRSSRHLVLFVERFSKDHFADLEDDQVVPNSELTTAVSEWKIKTLKDGYYKILLVSALSHNSTITYGINQVVYGSTADHTGLFVSLDENVPENIELSNPYYWAPVNKIEDFPELTENGTDYLCKDHIHDLKSRVCIAETALLYAGNKCDCPDEAITKKYYWSLLYHHASIYSAAFGEYKEAGRFLDQVIDRCTNGSAEDLDEDCGCNG